MYKLQLDRNISLVTGKQHQYTEHDVVQVAIENIKNPTHRKQVSLIKHYNVTTLCNHVKFMLVSAEACTAL